MCFLKNVVSICIFSYIEWKSFTNITKYFVFLVLLYRQDCQNCLLLVLENRLRESFSSGRKNKICWNFRSLIGKILGICRKFLDVVLQSDFYVNRGIYWERKQFQKKVSFNHFRELGKIFRLLEEKIFDVSFRNTC